MLRKNDIDDLIPMEVSHQCQAAQKSAIFGKLKKRSTLKSLCRRQMSAKLLKTDTPIPAG